MGDILDLKLKAAEVTEAARCVALELVKFQNAQAWAESRPGGIEADLARVQRKLFEVQLHQLLERCGELAAEVTYG